MSSEKASKGSNKKSGNPRNNSGKKSDSGKKIQQPKVVMNSNKKIIKNPNPPSKSPSKSPDSPKMTILKPKMIQISHSPTRVDTPPTDSVKKELTFEKPIFGDFFKMVNQNNEFQNNTSLFHENQNFHVIANLGESKVGKSYLLNKFVGEEELKVKQDTTTGIDLYVTPKERVFLIDSQAIFGSSVLYNLMNKDKSVPLETVNHENYVDLQSIKMGLFLLNICDVILVTMNDLHDLKTLQFMKTLDLLQKGFTNISKMFAEIVFVYNQIENISTCHILQSHYLLNKFYKDTSFLNNGYVHPFQWTDEMITENQINFFIIENDSTEELFIKLIKTMNIEKEKKINEFQWFQYVNNFWEALQKSHFLQEYNHCFQKLQMYK
eukprot:gene4503-7883_t